MYFECVTNSCFKFTILNFTPQTVIDILTPKPVIMCLKIGTHNNYISTRILYELQNLTGNIVIHDFRVFL